MAGLRNGLLTGSRKLICFRIRFFLVWPMKLNVFVFSHGFGIVRFVWDRISWHLTYLDLYTGDGLETNETLRMGNDSWRRRAERTEADSFTLVSPSCLSTLVFGLFWRGFAVFVSCVCLWCVLKYPGLLPIIASFSSTVSWVKGERPGTRTLAAHRQKKTTLRSQFTSRELTSNICQSWITLIQVLLFYVWLEIGAMFWLNGACVVVVFCMFCLFSSMSKMCLHSCTGASMRRGAWSPKSLPGCNDRVKRQKRADIGWWAFHRQS